MIRKANKTLIGMFVVGAAALLLAAIAIFGSGALFKVSDKYVLYFDGSVKGLSEGAPVVFRGVKIGNISNITPVYDPKSNKVLISVVIDVELARVKGVPDTIGYPEYEKLVNDGLRGRLEIQNFITGQLMVAFDFYTDKPANTYGIKNKYPELPALTVSPDIFAIMNEIPIKEIMHNLKETVEGLNRLVNSQGISELDKTLEEVTDAARSIRLFIEYLEQHPEAFLKGKVIRKGE
ncbi:MAG: MlaD family protein [Candidatus Omnitrophota bacterium]|jgi:paraquat-inducible protein B